MATYEVTSPDGATYQVTAPDGASQDQVMQYVQSQHGASSAPPAQSSPGIGQAIGTLVQRASHLGPSMLVGGPWLPDIGMGALQAVGAGAEALGAAVGERAPVAAANKWLLNKYQQEFGQLPGSAANRAVGNAAPVMAIPAVGEGVLANTVMGGAQGALANAATPAYDVPDSQYWATKGQQLKQGAEIGAPLGGALGVVGKVLGPTPAAAALAKDGVTPTIGQTMGGWWKPLEEKLSSIPILGDAIKDAQATGLDSFNRAIYNRILAPIGQTYKGPVGQPALASLKNTFSQAYEGALSKMSPSPLTGDFVAGIDKLDGMLAPTPEAQKIFRNAINGTVWPRFTESNTLTPSVLKDVDSRLGGIARQYAASADPDQRMASQAMYSALSGLRQMAAAANPEQAPVLRAVDNGYSQLVQLQNAAKGTAVARRAGVVTPADYLRGIKTGDTSARDSVFSSGRAMNQDFAQNADKTLSNTYPDSGTSGRGLLGAAIGMAAMGELSPHLLMGAGAAAIPYLPIGRQLVSLLPKTAGVAGRLAPYSGLSAPMIAGLLANQ